MFWSKITEGFLVCFDIQKPFYYMFWGLLSRLVVYRLIHKTTIPKHVENLFIFLDQNI